MKALNFIFESNGLLYSQKIKLSKINDYKVDYYDFDQNTFSDFEDYINFMNFSEYKFITLTPIERLPKFISYMADKINTKFIIISYDEFIKKLDTQEKIDTTKISDSLFTLKKIHFNQILSNGYKSCVCQLYPASLRRNLIKHIFIDDLNDLEKISETVLSNMAINSEFIFKGSVSEKLNKLPFICNPENKFKKAMPAPQAVSFNYLYEKITDFISNGKITKLNPYIEDYGSITGIDDFHSLRIFDGSYYLDMQKERKLGDISDSYKVLINNYSLINQDNKFKQINQALLRIFPFLIYIEEIYGSGTVFVTPYNYYKLQKVDKIDNNIDWIGFNTPKNNYVYNLNKNRLFKVTSSFLDSFEYIIKNQVGNSRNKKMIEKIQEKLDNVK